MPSNLKLRKGLRLVAAWAVLGAILACGGNDDDDAPQPVAPTTTTTPTPTTPPPTAGAATGQPFALSPGFAPDPRTATGTGGGPTAANTLNPACRGYIAARPNHTLTTAQAFNNLRILAHSDQDTTLVVQLANGTYLCNDDAEGRDPIVQGAFPAGTHNIFVGTYAPNTTANYTIGLSELSSVTAASLGGGAAPPTVGGGAPAGGTTLVQLSPGFMPDPNVGRGTAGGALAANTLNANCRGYLPTVPQHTLMAQGAFNNLRVLVRSVEDTTLVIRMPDGQYRCADDDEGFNPIVQGAFPAGTYQVWVGAYNATATPAYTIGFSELSSVTAASLPQ